VNRPDAVTVSLRWPVCWSVSIICSSWVQSAPTWRSIASFISHGQVKDCVDISSAKLTVPAVALPSCKRWPPPRVVTHAQKKTQHARPSLRKYKAQVNAVRAGVICMSCKAHSSSNAFQVHIPVVDWARLKARAGPADSGPGFVVVTTRSSGSGEPVNSSVMGDRWGGQTGPPG
jgi:hypothetical protein